MLISTALLLDSNIRNSVCTPAKLPCRRVEVGYEKIAVPPGGGGIRVIIIIIIKSEADFAAAPPNTPAYIQFIHSTGNRIQSPPIFNTPKTSSIQNLFIRTAHTPRHVQTPPATPI
jgi:hypothetical protein